MVHKPLQPTGASIGISRLKPLDHPDVIFAAGCNALMNAFKEGVPGFGISRVGKLVVEQSLQYGPVGFRFLQTHGCQPIYSFGNGEVHFFI